MRNIWLGKKRKNLTDASLRDVWAAAKEKKFISYSRGPFHLRIKTGGVESGLFQAISLLGR